MDRILELTSSNVVLRHEVMLIPQTPSGSPLRESVGGSFYRSCALPKDHVAAIGRVAASLFESMLRLYFINKEIRKLEAGIARLEARLKSV